MSVCDTGRHFLSSYWRYRSHWCVSFVICERDGSNYPVAIFSLRACTLYKSIWVRYTILGAFRISFIAVVTLSAIALMYMGRESPIVTSFRAPDSINSLHRVPCGSVRPQCTNDSMVPAHRWYLPGSGKQSQVELRNLTRRSSFFARL
jgi:hypothetical protein